MRSDPDDPVVSLAEVDFPGSVLESELPVLVAFSAAWCAPCAWLDPYLRRIEEEFGARLKVCKVEVDEAPELVLRFRIASVPTVILFSAGVEVGRSLGIEPDRLREMVAGAVDPGAETP